MLCIDVTVNNKAYIGGIHIQRLTDVQKKGMCEYIIREPKDGPWNDVKFKHNYDKGWFPLLEKALKILKKHGYKTDR